MDENLFNDSHIEMWKWSLHVIRAYLSHDLYFAYVEESQLESLV